MFKPVRVVATIVFLASIGLIFVSAFVIKSDVRIHILAGLRIYLISYLSDCLHRFVAPTLCLLLLN